MHQFTECISEISNKEIDHGKNIGVVMPTYNLRGYSDNYSKTSGSLWQYYRYGPFIGNNSNTIDVSDDLDSASFKCRHKITGQTGNSGTNIQMMGIIKIFKSFLDSP